MPFRISNDHIIQKRLENCQFYGGTESAHKRTLKNRFRSNHFYKETDQITLNIVHCNSSLVKCLAFVMVFCVCVLCATVKCSTKCHLLMYKVRYIARSFKCHTNAYLQLIAINTRISLKLIFCKQMECSLHLRIAFDELSACDLNSICL